MLQAIVTVLAVINPVVCGSIFLTLTPDLESQTEAACRHPCRAQHPHHSCCVRVHRTPGARRFRHFVGRIPDRWRDHHRVYGVRHAGRRAEGRSSAPIGGGRHRCAGLAYSAHHVCRGPRDDYRRGDNGRCAHAETAFRYPHLWRQRSAPAVTFGGPAACQSVGIADQPEQSSHGHTVHGAHRNGHGHAIRADRLQGIHAFLGYELVRLDDDHGAGADRFDRLLVSRPGASDAQDLNGWRLAGRPDR